MIKSTELRIGNLANNPFMPNYPYAIKYYDFDGNRTKSFDPIPLTHEILDKFGFVYTASFGECRYAKGDMMMDENFNPLVQEARETLYYGKRIKYVHQLQNLYFDLTGEELTINL